MKAIAIALVLLAFVPRLHARVWTLSEGGTIDGDYVGADEMQVTIKMRDGTVVRVLRALLSAEDRKILPQLWMIRIEDRNPFAKPIPAPWEPQEYSPREVKPVPAIIITEQSLWDAGRLNLSREIAVSTTTIPITGTIRTGMGTLVTPRQKPEKNPAADKAAPKK